MAKLHCSAPLLEASYLRNEPSILRSYCIQRADRLLCFLFLFLLPISLPLEGLCFLGIILGFVDSVSISYTESICPLTFANVQYSPQQSVCGSYCILQAAIRIQA